MKQYLILILFCPLFLVAQVCETIYPSEYADSIQYCVTDASCHNTCDGSIVVTVFGSNQPYYFEWNNSNVAIAGDNSRSNLCASSHIITITDSSGNLVNNTQVNNVEEPTNFSVFEIVNDPTCHGYLDGSIDLTIGGSVPFSTSPSYLYSWDDGVNTEDRSSLASGVYILTITDANGCTRIDTFNIVDPVEVSVNTIGDTLSCISSCDGQAIVSPISGVAPFTFVWDNPIVLSNDTVSNLCYGLSTVLVTDANGCFITDSVFIDNPDTLMISSIIVDSACYQMCDGEISVNIQGGVSPYIVTWTLNEIVLDTLNTTISDLCSETYTLSYIDANNCANTLDIFLAERDSFNLVSSVINDSCYNSCKGQISVNLLNPNSPPFIYNWSNGSVGNIASNLCSDSINLELIDNSGCRDTFIYFIEQPVELSFDSVSIINNICYLMLMVR